MRDASCRAAPAAAALLRAALHQHAPASPARLFAARVVSGRRACWRARGAATPSGGAQTLHGCVHFAAFFGAFFALLAVGAAAFFFAIATGE